MGVTLSSENDLPPRDRWARLRFAIIGPLLAAPPGAGELHEALTVLAAKTWRHPFTGLDVRFGVSTLERWYYAAKKAADPVQVLRNQVRHDIGRFPSLSAEAVQSLTTQYHAHPGWTAKSQACDFAVNQKDCVLRRKQPDPRFLSEIRPLNLRIIWLQVATAS